MNNRRSRISNTLAVQSAELALAVPQVMTHRMIRMAIAGNVLSQRDSDEFKLMGDEKKIAFANSWRAMAWQGLLNYQTLTFSMFSAFWSVWFGRKPNVQAMARQWQAAAVKVLEKGLAPVHGTAVANAKRLARTNLR